MTQSSPERDLQRVLAASQVPSYNTAAVARRCGVPAATFRAWERRYGFPSPDRGSSQQRLYAEQDIQAIIWLRDRIAEGLTISAALAILRSRFNQRSLPQPALHPHVVAPLDPASATPMPELASRLEGALLAFDGPRATLALSEAFGLYSLEQVGLDVIQPALHRIGLGWERGEVDVAQEHFASGYIRQRLTSLLDVTNPSQHTRVAVAACGPDEWHEIGLLMVALFLARSGWHVIYLGASLPSGQLDRYLTTLRPDAIVLSASTDQAAATLSEIVRTLAALPAPLPVIGYGGFPFEQQPALRDGLRGLYLGPDAASAVARLNEALNADSP